MKFKIGFMTQSNEEEHIESSPVVTSPREKEGVKSLVQVYFHSRNMTLTYYNDRFDLRRGDMVYVDGRLAGQRGRVVDIAYNFKIKPSKYQKVVSVVNTDIHGDFYLAGSHFLTFDPKALPKNKP